MAAANTERAITVTIEELKPQIDDDGADENDALLDGEDASELAPEGTEEKVTFDEAQQAVFNREIDKKTRATHDEKRRGDRLETELAEANAKIPTALRPNIPPMPDQYDDNFDELMATRDKAIADGAAFDASAEHSAQATRDREQQQQNDQLGQLQTKVDSYAKRAGDLGISADALRIAGGAVKAHGIDPELAMHIIGDDMGPAITKHLADNPQVLDQVAEMSPMQAAIFIETNVKPSLSGKPSTNAPLPAQTIKGGGAPPSERGPEGATFE